MASRARPIKACGAGARQLVAYTMNAGPSEPWDTSLIDAHGNPRPAYHAIAAATRARARRN